MEKALKKVSVFWFRRDLRLFDNAGLFHALKGEFPVLPIFIFDRYILETLADREDKRLQFIHDKLRELNKTLQDKGSTLQVFYGAPKEVFQELLGKYEVQEVFTNHDYEPYAIRRDKEVSELLAERGIGFQTFKDQVIFERSEVMKPDGKPYTVFTPYSRKWKEIFLQKPVEVFENEGLESNYFKTDPEEIISLEKIGFRSTSFALPPLDLSRELIGNYENTRNFPAEEGTTNLGIYLRFGTVSVRQIVLHARQHSETFLSELIWREFFMMILYHFPKVEHENFRRKYDRIPWRNNENEFDLWCKGETGFPIVDAGMRELNETGRMHNRVRMIVAGFLTKHLLIDWRWGEAYFAQKLLDYELASNNGNWQWAAGTGCDSAPYFRVFNPDSQVKKFDPELEYIKRWIPNFRAGYLEPIVDHKFARARALETYKKALNSK